MKKIEVSDYDYWTQEMFKEGFYSKEILSIGNWAVTKSNKRSEK